MPRVLCAGRRRVPTKAAGSPAPWAVWLAARLAPASVARWAPSTACSEFPIAAITAAAITTATVVSAVIADQLAVIASAAKQSIATSEDWIASSRSLSSGAHSRDPLAPRNDEKNSPLLRLEIAGVRLRQRREFAAVGLDIQERRLVEAIEAADQNRVALGA